eukprot:3252383-Rhodomonas_salina.2
MGSRSLRLHRTVYMTVSGRRGLWTESNHNKLPHISAHKPPILSTRCDVLRLTCAIREIWWRARQGLCSGSTCLHVDAPRQPKEFASRAVLSNMVWAMRAPCSAGVRSNKRRRIHGGSEDEHPILQQKRHALALPVLTSHGLHSMDTRERAD